MYKLVIFRLALNKRGAAAAVSKKPAEKDHKPKRPASAFFIFMFFCHTLTSWSNNMLKALVSFVNAMESPKDLVSFVNQIDIGRRQDKHSIIHQDSGDS